MLGTCDLVVRSDDAAASLVVMLRMLRFFRILWIFKNFNVLSISTVLGRLQVGCEREGSGRRDGARRRNGALCTVSPVMARPPAWPPSNECLPTCGKVTVLQLCRCHQYCQLTCYPAKQGRPPHPLQDEFYSARWLISLVELLIVLVFLGHLSGCFFYFFSGPSWWSAGGRTQRL